MKAFRDDEAAIAQRAEELLDIFNLRRFRDAPAKSLPYGEQRRLEIVRCLATKPKLLLLDEPAAGMNPTEKVELVRLIQQIQQQFKLSVLLVEHSMKVVMGVCQRIAVLDYGVKIAEGTPAQIQVRPESDRSLPRRGSPEEPLASLMKLPTADCQMPNVRPRDSRAFAGIHSAFLTRHSAF
jgi:branched-chain amino acid transport system ATP-binding protein